MLSKIKSVDNKVLDNIGRIHRPSLNMIMATASRICNFGIVWWCLCILFMIRPTKLRLAGVNIVLALSIAHIMGEIIIKHVVKRIRPCHKLEDDEQIINRPKFYSFPSGHTTASFSVVGVAVLRCSPIVFIPILCLATIIAFSRLYLRVHYLTDVIVGMLLGLFCGISSVFIFNALVKFLY